jgi:DNA-binding CsgD family transcriptional regulator
MSFREIGLRLGISEAEASSICARALRKLETQRDTFVKLLALSSVVYAARELREADRENSLL